MARILVVEPNASLRWWVRKGLEDEGWQAQATADSIGALASLAAFRPDVILIAVRPQQRTSLDFCQALRCVPETAAIPVVIWSASREWEVEPAGGYAAYLEKPVALDVLDRTLRAVVANTAAAEPGRAAPPPVQPALAV